MCLDRRRCMQSSRALIGGGDGWGWAVQQGELVAVSKLNVFREREVFGPRDPVCSQKLTVEILDLDKTDSQFYVDLEESRISARGEFLTC